MRQCNTRGEDVAADGLQFHAEAFEHRFVFVGADDGAAASREFGGGSGLAGRKDHSRVLLRDFQHAAAEVEIHVDEFRKFFMLACENGVTSKPRVFREFAHGLDEITLLLFVKNAELVVVDAGKFRAIRSVGDIELGKTVRREAFIDAVVVLFEIFFGKIHVHEAVIDLDDTILHAALDAEILFGLPAKRRPQFERNLVGDFIEFDKRFERGGADGAGAAHADELRDFRRIADGEIPARQFDVVLDAVFVELANGRFDETDAAVITETFDFADHGAQAREFAIVFAIVFDADFRAFVDSYGAGKIRKRESDGFAEITVRWIAEKACAAICFDAEKHVFPLLLG